MIAAAAEYEYSKSFTGLRLDKIGKGYLRAAYMPVWNSIVPKEAPRVASLPPFLALPYSSCTSITRKLPWPANSKRRRLHFVRESGADHML